MIGLLPTMVSPESVIWAAKPLIWFDARMASGVDGTAVASWGNRMGSAHVAAQATAASRPVVKRGTALGSVVRFDGINDWLDAGAIDLSGTYSASYLLAFSHNAAGQVYLEVGGNWQDGQIIYYTHAASATDYSVRTGNVGDSYCNPPVTSGAQVSGAVLDGTPGLNAMTTWLHGVAGVTPATIQANTDTLKSTLGLHIGSSLGAAYFTSADISHILLFDRALPAASMAAVSRALMSLCGI